MQRKTEGNCWEKSYRTIGATLRFLAEGEESSDYINLSRCIMSQVNWDIDGPGGLIKILDYFCLWGSCGECWLEQACSRIYKWYTRILVWGSILLNRSAKFSIRRSIHYGIINTSCALEVLAYNGKTNGIFAEEDWVKVLMRNFFGLGRYGLKFFSKYVLSLNIPCWGIKIRCLWQSVSLRHLSHSGLIQLWLRSLSIFIMLSFGWNAVLSRL